MAALYLHNALFALQDHPIAPPIRHKSSSHLRNSSSVSTVTLHTATSRPTEPLLPATVTGSQGLLPAHPDGADADPSLDYRQNSLSNTQWDGHWENTFARRLRMLKLWKRILLVTICAWASYNSIRYFLSFPSFISQERQLFALVLGASTTLSLALVGASILFNVLLPPDIDFPISSGIINIIQRIVLPYFASWFILAPSIVNFVLVFVWKHSSDPQKTLQGRCSWDIDVVWSGIGMRCRAPGSSPGWPPWLIGAFFRLVFTFCVLAYYHAVCHRYEVTRRPGEERPYTRFPIQRHHHRDSSLANSNPGVAAFHSYIPVPSMISAPPIVHRHQYHRSLSAVDDIENSAHSMQTVHRSESGQPSQPKTPKITPSHSNNNSPVVIPAELSSSLAGQSSSSDDNISVEISTGDTSLPSGRFASGSNDTDVFGFVNRFQAMVDQMSKDTDDGLNLTRPESRMDHRQQCTGSPSSYDEDAYNPYDKIHQTPPTSSTEGDDWYYNEFGQRVSLQHPDNDEGRVEVFGRIVHRMPTIESLGSREHASLVTPSLSLHHAERDISSRSNTSDQDPSGSPVSWGRARSNSWDTTSRVPSRQAYRASGETSLSNELVSWSAPCTTPDLGATGRSGGEISIVTSSSRSTTANTFYSAIDGPAGVEIE